MIKYAVRSALSGRVLSCFLACLLPMLISWAIQLVPSDLLRLDLGFDRIAFAGLSVDSSILPIALSTYGLSFIASTLLTNPMQVQLGAFFITLNRDPEHLPSPFSVCDCFGPGYLRLVGGMLLRALLIYVWAAVPMLVAALIPGAWQVQDMAGAQTLVIADWMNIPLLLSSILATVRGIRLSMVPYLLSDMPGISPGEAARESLAMTRGRAGELFILQLSFIGWIFVAAVTFMIASVYAYPYIEGTYAAYYIAYSQPMPWEEKEPYADAP